MDAGDALQMVRNMRGAGRAVRPDEPLCISFLHPWADMDDSFVLRNFGGHSRIFWHKEGPRIGKGSWVRKGWLASGRFISHPLVVVFHILGIELTT